MPYKSFHTWYSHNSPLWHLIKKPRSLRERRNQGLVISSAVPPWLALLKTVLTHFPLSPELRCIFIQDSKAGSISSAQESRTSDPLSVDCPKCSIPFLRLAHMMSCQLCFIHQFRAKSDICQYETVIFRFLVWAIYDNVLIYHKGKCPSIVYNTSINRWRWLLSERWYYQWMNKRNMKWSKH